MKENKPENQDDFRNAEAKADTTPKTDAPGVSRMKVDAPPNETRTPGGADTRDFAPKYTERDVHLANGVLARETTLTKTFEGAPVNYRSDAAAKKVDLGNRQQLGERFDKVLPTDEAGHKFAASQGAAIGETPTQAAGDMRNLSPQSESMNRGTGSPWRQMENDICKYRTEHPESRITASVTERFVPEKQGDRPISREVSITDQSGQTPEALKKWTAVGSLAFMNPEWQSRDNKRS